MEYITFTQLVQLAEEDVMNLHVHILPDHTSAQLYAWFGDKHNQELLALVYESILSVSAKLDLENVPPQKPDFHIKRSKDVRALFIFKPTNTRQHMVIPQHPESFSGLVPRAAFISDEGRKVLPFLNKKTEGSGYKSLRILGKSLDAYVDCYNITDSRGIFKILARLYPQRPLCSDIKTFFQLPSSSSPALDSICDLANIPNKALSTLPPKKKKENKARKTLVRGSKITRKVQVAVRQSDHLSLKDIMKRKSSSDAVESASLLDYMDLSTNTLDKFCDISSQKDNLSVEHIPSSGAVDKSDETPPLSPVSDQISLPVSPACCREMETESSTGCVNSSVSTSSKHALSNDLVGELSILDKTTVIVSSSDEDSSTDQSSMCSRPPTSIVSSNSALKQKKLKHPKEILKGAESVTDLSLEQVRSWICFRKPLVVDIFKRSVFSRRHEDFISSHKKRDTLKYQLDTRMFAKEQVDLVTELLLHIFCGQHMKYFSYVMSVLLPECLIRIVADVHSVGFEQAEEMMMNYQRGLL